MMLFSHERAAPRNARSTAIMPSPGGAAPASSRQWPPSTIAAALAWLPSIVAATLVLAIVLAISLPIPADASYRRHDEVPVPDIVTVRYTRQGWIDVVMRVLLFGMSRSGQCQICYGGQLRIASDKTGPGGELNVVYYRGSAPERGNAHCKDGAAFTIPESELRYYEKFAGLKQRALAAIEAGIARAVAGEGAPPNRAEAGAAADADANVALVAGSGIPLRAAVGDAAEGVPLRRVIEPSEDRALAVGAVHAVASNRFVTSAEIGAAEPDAGSVPFGEPCKICPTREGSYDRFKVVKGFMPYVDPDTRETRRAVVWEYWSRFGSARPGEEPGAASWRECSAGAWYVEPDFIGRTLEVMSGLFEDHALEQMERLVVQIEEVHAP